MKNKSRFLCLVISFFLITPWIFAAERILIHVHLFQAVWTEDQPGLKQIEVLTTSSRPELSSLKEMSASTDIELTASVIETLLDIYGLNAIEDLFLHQKWWDGNRLYDIQWDGNFRPGRRPPPFPFDLIIGQSVFYGIKLVPKMLPAQKIALNVVVYKNKKGAKSHNDVEIIADQNLVLGIADPVIIEWPSDGGSYFMMVMLTVGDPSKRRAETKKAQESPQIRLISTPKVLTQVQPLYPEELRKRLVGGEIGLLITIDEKGIVQRVDVEKRIHPYLNYAAVQAFLQWTFEPLVLEGKPVPAAFRYSYYFYPRAYAPENVKSATPPAGSSDSFSQEKLPAVLAGSGDYCQKLLGAALNFICEERIKETHYNLLKNISWIVSGPRRKRDEQSGYFEIPPDAKPSVFMRYFGASESESAESGKIRDTGQNLAEKAAIQMMDPKRTIRNDFLCDYLIVKKSENIEERRIILKENGQKNADRSKLLNEKRFSGLSSLFAPLRVLAKDKQAGFNFRIIDEERVHGKAAYVIEATPKPEYEDAIWTAKFWIDKKSYQTLKSEVEGVPIDAYEEVLDDCVDLNIKPIFVTTHEYGTEKNGIMYPSRSKVNAAYPGIDNRGSIKKLGISLAYDKYKFFMVETEPKIIK
jgi:TonB family protein